MLRALSHALVSLLAVLLIAGEANAQGTWSLVTPAAPWSARDSAGEVVFNNEMWLLGGFTPDRVNDVWHSPNGVNWTQATPAAPWEARNLPGSVVYDNRMWIMGGVAGGSGPWFNDVWSSTNGSNWTRATASAPWSGRGGLGALVYDDKMWVIGGMGDFDGTDHYNDVWWSTDGAHWTQSTASAPWAQRAMHTTLVFDDKMWVIGGGVYDTHYPMNVGPNYADVWYSTNGTDWTQAIASMAAGDRRFHSSVVYDDRMWIVAGYTSVPTPGNKNDVWSSADGVNWVRELPLNSPWPLRHEVSLLTHGDSMYMMGGFGSVLYNDVWKYQAIPEPSNAGACLVLLSAGLLARGARRLRTRVWAVEA